MYTRLYHCGIHISTKIYTNIDIIMPNDLSFDKKRTLPMVVFLPGMLNTADLFCEQQGFLENTFRIYHADTYSYDCLYNMARGVLDNTAGDLLLIGLSMGGYCALEIFNQCPDRVKGLVLFNSGATPPTHGNILLRKSLIRQAQTGRFIGTTNAVLDMVLGSAHRHDKNIRNRLRKMSDSLGREVYIRQQTAIMHRPDPRPALVNATVPSLFIVGKEDKIVPPEDLYMVAQSKPNATYYVFDNAAHMCPLEFPEKCQKYLKQWLNVHFNVDL